MHSYNDFRNKAVLITGGTKGIGLATGLAFGRHGAEVYLTHRWGSADEDQVRGEFAEVGAPAPQIIESDVINDDDTVRLLERIGERHEGVAVFVSNVCAVQPATGIASYKRRSLLKSLEYSAWPLVRYLQKMDQVLGRLPRYVVGMSSDGPDQYFSRYEYVAASKATMDVLCRYLSYHLRDQPININILRTRNVLTDAVYEIFGETYVKFMRKYAGDEYMLHPEEIGSAVLALCSGLLDAMNGQVIQVDKGMAFADTLMRLMELREDLGLEL